MQNKEEEKFIKEYLNSLEKEGIEKNSALGYMFSAFAERIKHDDDLKSEYNFIAESASKYISKNYNKSSEFDGVENAFDTLKQISKKSGFNVVTFHYNTEILKSINSELSISGAKNYSRLAKMLAKAVKQNPNFCNSKIAKILGTKPKTKTIEKLSAELVKDMGDNLSLDKAHKEMDSYYKIIQKANKKLNNAIPKMFR